MSEVRAWVYREVGQLFDRVPGTLTTPEAELDAEYPETLQAARALCADFGRRDRVELEAEQVRLFVNARDGVPAPPYASFWLDGELLGPTTAWVAGQYREQGLQLVEDAGEPPDFVSAELEFLHFLGRHERAARITGDAQALEAAREASARFFEAHLDRWLPLFAGAVQSVEPEGFYAAVTAVLLTFCEEERRRLASRAKA